MIRVGKQFQGSTRTKVIRHLLEQRQMGKLVTVALQEQHGDSNIE
jgi:hypothetical protein